MKVSEILSRLNGVSSPFVGVSWVPPTADVAIARRLIAEVETRRVLFSTYTDEVPEQCVSSVLALRQLFTEILAAGGVGLAISDPVRVMRRYCVGFLTKVGASETREVPHDRHLFREARWHMHDYRFGEALGELRAGVGLQVGIVAASFGLEVEDALGRMLPPAEG